MHVLGKDFQMGKGKAARTSQDRHDQPATDSIRQARVNMVAGKVRI